MKTYRRMQKIVTARPVTEGAGVRLRRAIGLGSPEEFDPFLLLDDFRSDTPSDYLAGFPWHPHRGIETVTYVLRGTVEHGDSTGTKGTIGAGDVQWMTAGSGIFHREMPKGDGAGSMHGFQLWVNLPAGHKMTDPRYRGVAAADIPVLGMEGGAEVRVIAGEFAGVAGAVTEVIASPLYLDVRLPAGGTFEAPVRMGDTAFVYVHEGECLLDAGDDRTVTARNRDTALFADGDAVRILGGSSGARFLFVAGTPLGEPVAWRGPIVMNTEEELRKAWEELEEGTFIKSKADGKES